MALNGGLVYRVASRAIISPYVRAAGGILFTTQSSIRMIGQFPSVATGEPVDAVIYPDNSDSRVTPTAVLGLGFTSAISRGYQLRWEVRDNIATVRAVTGATAEAGSRRPPPRASSTSSASTSDSTWCSNGGEDAATSGSGAGRIRGAILAGGGATRFGGRPKGLEAVGGERILDRLVRAFTDALGSAPLLVANDPAAGAWRPDLVRTADVQPGLGSLGGIFTAVSEAPAPVVCVAWDMPFVPATLIEALAAGLEQADVCIPAERWPPRARAPLRSVRPRLPRRDRAAPRRRRSPGHRLPPAVRVDILPLDAVRTLGDPDRPVLQREHRGRPRAGGGDLADYTHHLDHRPEEHRKDHADGRPRERVRTAGAPGHDASSTATTRPTPTAWAATPGGTSTRAPPSGC